MAIFWRASVSMALLPVIFLQGFRSDARRAMESILRIILVAIFVVGPQKGGEVKGYMVGDNPYHRRENLDPKGRYVLEWCVDWEESRVTFNVTVETRGYVGFGLSGDGKMGGADVVMGGVKPHGKTYFSDRHAVANQFPEEDDNQDWKLLEARETKTHTFLSFSRAFDTCDDQDYPITEDRIAVIWAFGEEDNLREYHHRNRGMFNVHLLHPDYTPPITRDATGAPLSVGEGPGSSEVKVWTVATEIEMPSAHTTYLCTIHATPPNLWRRHHVIGVEARFPNEDVRPHVHHLLVYKCNVPQGQNRSPQSLFGSYVGQPGQPCLLPQLPSGPMPTYYCTQLVDGWAIGNRVVFHPPHVGMPIESNEYYMVQTHYDNPNQVSGKRVAVNLDYFYTPKLRQFESGVLVVSNILPGLPPSTLVPPSSPGHTIYGMCSPECTKTMFPPEGVTLFMLNMHSHNAGSRMKVQHFRDGKELPWILSDDNYSNQFQQVRVINREVKVLPGDQLIMTCVYDNTRANGTTVSGFSTTQEMCSAFTWIYSRVAEFSVCGSGHDSIEQRRRFLAGVGNVTWQESLLEYVVDPPHPLAGLTITQVSDNHVDWNLKRRADLQEFHRTSLQNQQCPMELFAQVPGSTQPAGNGEVKYPQRARPYNPPQSCSFTQ